MKLGYKISPDQTIVGQKNSNYLAAVDLDLAEYDDISDISNWWHSDVMDWSRRRDEIKPLFYIKAGLQLQNFATLTEEEKYIGGKCFFIPHALRLTLWDEDEDVKVWSELLSLTKTSRIDCIESMRKAVGDLIRLGSLSLSQTQEFDKDTNIIINWFERSNAPDFKLWLTNEVGSAYENNGFSQKTYYSGVLKTKLLDIYNGFY